MTERCKRCKRTLKNTTSVVHGYGPVCWKKAIHDAMINKIPEPELEEKVYMSVE